MCDNAAQKAKRKISKVKFRMTKGIKASLMAAAAACAAVSAPAADDACGCTRIELGAVGRTVKLPMRPVDLSASPQFELDAYAEDPEAWDGAMYLALLDGKGRKRRYGVCDLDPGCWNVMRFSAEWDSHVKDGDIDWRDIRAAQVWVPASRNARTAVWLGNLRPAPRPTEWRTPTRGERRFAWCLLNALGDRGDWKETAEFLAKWRFTDVIVQAGRAGGVYYDSAVVPRSKICGPGHDPLREALAACRARGIRVHAMIAAFRFPKGEAPDDWRAKFDAQGLFQRDADGSQLQHHADRWLCPADPRTAELLVAMARELVEEVGVDGVQLDFIRYSTERMCFCPRCLDLFSRGEGRTFADAASVTNDPAVRERWRSFREGRVSSVVKAVGDALHASARKAEFSATCFPQAEKDRAKVAQDYGRWAREGWIDMLFPMDYTEDTRVFRSEVSRQARTLAGTNVRLYPGIGICRGFTANPARFVRHVNVCRELGLPGFAAYVLDPRGERFYAEFEKTPYAKSAQGWSDGLFKASHER